MLTIDVLNSRFSDYFSSFEPVGDSIARFVRSSEGHPFAVYYVDVSEKIPASMEELDAYQDSVIASRYFQGPKSLQWSHWEMPVGCRSHPEVPERILGRSQAPLPSLPWRAVLRSRRMRSQPQLGQR